MRANTILGLSLELLRKSRRARRNALVVALCAVVGGGVWLQRIAAARVAPTAPREIAGDRWRESFDTPRARGSVFLRSPRVVPTPSGFILAWERDDDHGGTIQVAALDREGRLRSAPRAVSAPDIDSRLPSLARGPEGAGLVWTSAITAPDRWEPSLWFTAVNGAAETAVPARQISPEHVQAYTANIAWSGASWGVGAISWERPQMGYTFVRLRADGVQQGDSVRVPMDVAASSSDLVWSDGAWMSVCAVFAWQRDEGALGLTWFGRDGRVFDARTVARSPGMNGATWAFARGSTTWLTWGADEGRTARHDPRFARIENRVLVGEPRSLGARRSGSGVSLACGASVCTAAWTALDPEGGRGNVWVQRLDLDGAPLSSARSLGVGRVARWGAQVSTAMSADERETFVVWVRPGEPIDGLMLARLGADGAVVQQPLHE